MIKLVRINKRAQYDILRVPQYIRVNLFFWVKSVEEKGLEEVRKIPGFHDEPLKGKRAGQRSIRLNKAYRAIYQISDDGTLEFIEVIEVNKHEY